MFSSNAAARNFHQYRSSERCWPNSGLGAVSIPCRESSLPLCFAFLSEHSCLLGWESPAREGWGTARATAGAQYQALHSAGTYDCARNGREHQALVRLESILLSVNFRLYSWLYTLCFTTDLSTCFNLPSFLGHIFRGSQPTIRPLQIQMHTHFTRKGTQPNLPS